jgi:NADPH:quinone reductase-like Zn-dependent oxidoreductase
MCTIQVATHLGFPAIYATSRPQHHAQLLALGATRVFDYTSPKVVEEIIAAAKFDNVALTTAYRAIGELQPVVDVVAAFGGGKVASAVPLDEHAPKQETIEIKFVMGPQEPDAVARHLEFVLLEWLAPRLQAGSYVPAPRARVVDGGLGAVDAALDILKGGVSGEKLVVEV